MAKTSLLQDLAHDCSRTTCLPSLQDQAGHNPPEVGSPVVAFHAVKRHCCLLRLAKLQRPETKETDVSTDAEVLTAAASRLMCSLYSRLQATTYPPEGCAEAPPGLCKEQHLQQVTILRAGLDGLLIGCYELVGLLAAFVHHAQDVQHLLVCRGLCHNAVAHLHARVMTCFAVFHLLAHKILV